VPIKIESTNSGLSNADITKSVYTILASVQLCSISTCSETRAHINAAYFCYTDDLDLFFVSDPSTQHGRNIDLNPKIAIAIFDTNQSWGEPLRGLQLFGECHLASPIESAKALVVHAARFHAYGDYIKSLTPHQKATSPHKFYVFRTRSVKVLDEAQFGEEVFVTASVIRS
jgi:uncharacterized protein YhbP (UPF0306 family)